MKKQQKSFQSENQIFSSRLVYVMLYIKCLFTMLHDSKSVNAIHFPFSKKEKYF